MAAAASIGELIEAVKALPQQLVDGLAGDHFHLQSLFGHRAPLPAQVLAPSGAAGRQEVVEAVVAAIEPVGLQTGAVKEARYGQVLANWIVGEQDQGGGASPVC